MTHPDLLSVGPLSSQHEVVGQGYANELAGLLRHKDCREYYTQPAPGLAARCSPVSGGRVWGASGVRTTRHIKPVAGGAPSAHCMHDTVPPAQGARLPGNTLPVLVVPVIRSCQSPIWIWLVNYLHLHLHAWHRNKLGDAAKVAAIPTQQELDFGYTHAYPPLPHCTMPVV